MEDVVNTFMAFMCTQYPKFFSEFGWNNPNSQVMEAYVRLPDEHANKVVFTVKQGWVAYVFG